MCCKRPYIKTFCKRPHKKHFGYSPTTDIHSPLWIVPFRGFGGFQPPKKNNRFSRNLQQMKNYFLAFTLAATISATAQHKTLAGFAYGNSAAPTGDEWQSPENLSLNKEYPRAYFFSFNNEKQATQVLSEYSPYWQSLNGQWRFHWCKTPRPAP